MLGIIEGDEMLMKLVEELAAAAEWVELVLAVEVVADNKDNNLRCTRSTKSRLSDDKEHHLCRSRSRDSRGRVK